jgi:hypothetical protein
MPPYFLLSWSLKSEKGFDTIIRLAKYAINCRDRLVHLVCFLKRIDEEGVGKILKVSIDKEFGPKALIVVRKK